MCGINGILKKGEDISARIVKMNQALKHRGPDSEGKYVDVDSGIAFGHRRLSVIDPAERSSQPMLSNSGRWILIYNGELYNYLDLKAQTPYFYKTDSDTEVVLAYIECYGIEEFLKKSNGMFAFAIYDRKKAELFLCRDRLGIKPLYYYADKETVVFSSEIKGILHSGLTDAILDEDSIDDYLAYRYVREPYTFFKNIYQVPAGSYIQISMNYKIRLEYYWNIPVQFNMDEKYDEKIIKREFCELLKKSVSKRMISDVPLGTYLSGGVDSSLLTAMAARNTQKQIHTFSVGFPDLNEFLYSDLVSEQYHTRNHKIIVSAKEYWENMQSVIAYKDAPLGVPNEVLLALMSKELKKDITVVISGEGADELLGGYGRLYRSPFEYYSNKTEAGFYHYFINKYEYVPRDIRDKFLNIPTKRREQFDFENDQAFRENKNEKNVFTFFHKYHIKGLLQRLDTTTMLASVEARVPFLDHELIEYTYERVPYELKLHWNRIENKLKAKSLSPAEFSELYDTPKYLLKEVAKGYLPQEVIQRKKVGFTVPLDQWTEELKKRMDESVSDSFWINRKEKDKLADQCATHPKGSQMLWMFINMQMFFDEYFTRKWTY